MADTKYQRLDRDQVVFLVNYMFQKLAQSPLKNNTTYTLEKTTDGKKIILKDNAGNTISTVNDENTTYGNATVDAAGLMAPSDKSKLNGLHNYSHPTYTAHGNGLYKITVDSTGHVSAIAAVSKSDITALGIPAQDTTYGAATTTAAGLMSAADKAKLAGIASGATAVTNNNQLTNGAGYQTAAQVQSAINTAVGKITGITFQVVTSLPTSGKTGVFYLIKDTHSDTSDNYDEYIWLVDSSKTNGGSFEKIGNTDVDLSGYVKASQMGTMTNDDLTSIVDSAYTASFS